MSEQDRIPPDVFDPDAPRELREQILRYQMAAVLTDRERARFFGLPATCRMREGAKIICPENLICGEHVYIGENALLDASGGLEIGDHTGIGSLVCIWTHSSHKAHRKMANVSGSADIERKPVRIGRGCMIAGPSAVLPGVTIGDRVLVTPMSLVHRDVADAEVFSNVREIEGRVKDLQRQIEDLCRRLDARGE